MIWGISPKIDVIYVGFSQEIMWPEAAINLPHWQ